MNNTNSNNINTSATNGSDIISGNPSSQTQNNQNQQQLLECLELKLDLILANQLRLEKLLVAQGSIVGGGALAEATQQINA